jgi:hypothetical protein
MGHLKALKNKKKIIHGLKHASGDEKRTLFAAQVPFNR